MEYSERDGVWMAKIHSCGDTVLKRLRSDYYNNTASNILLVNVVTCTVSWFWKNFYFSWIQKLKRTRYKKYEWYFVICLEFKLLGSISSGDEKWMKIWVW